MANCAYLAHAPTVEVALQQARENRRASKQSLDAKYSIPSLWLAAFEPADCTRIDGSTARWTALCAPTYACLARLSRRRHAVLDVIGPQWAGLYDALWARLNERFRPVICIHSEEIYATLGFDEIDADVQQRLATFAEADRGAIVRREPLNELRAARYSRDVATSLVGSDAAGWPPAESPSPAPAHVPDGIRPYAASIELRGGDLVRHVKFGDGLVVRVLDARKVEVLFADEARTLVHKGA
jgi:hypothetical protein